MKYIDADKLIKAIEEKGLDCSFALKMERLDTLALIDELQQEQPNLPGIEEEAAEKYADLNCHNHVENETDWNGLLYAFKAGAEWQKAKMMEGAVEGSCIEDLTAGSVIDTEYGVLYLPPDKFRFGDKVKIIIVKEEEQ